MTIKLIISIVVGLPVA